MSNDGARDDPRTGRLSHVVGTIATCDGNNSYLPEGSKLFAGFHGEIRFFIHAKNIHVHLKKISCQRQIQSRSPVAVYPFSRDTHMKLNLKSIVKLVLSKAASAIPMLVYANFAPGLASAKLWVAS